MLTILFEYNLLLYYLNHLPPFSLEFLILPLLDIHTELCQKSISVTNNCNILDVFNNFGTICNQFSHEKVLRTILTLEQYVISLVMKKS